jgi:hypothetical protein
LKRQFCNFEDIDCSQIGEKLKRVVAIGWIRQESEKKRGLCRVKAECDCEGLCSICSKARLISELLAVCFRRKHTASLFLSPTIVHLWSKCEQKRVDLCR